MTPNNEAIEAAARAYCAHVGKDPDKLTPAPRGQVGLIPLWEMFAPQLTAALTAALPMIRAQVLEEAAKALEDDAKLCDCFARSEGECGCGAWNDYKTVPMERAVALVRALKENHP